MYQNNQNLMQKIQKYNKIVVKRIPTNILNNLRLALFTLRLMPYIRPAIKADINVRRADDSGIYTREKSTEL